ncbi:hypothetical protein SAMN05444169_8285 [Bradyrhizobium erythrophlei]|uniref:Uncharacterized protein n=1 Tax=Bradyrhizobium erythrophlei TaxID=1437360 RepID=A0A1M5UAQ7_9BRAD|nr:hypothetical protein SAMN05444169_8285 [Bradyrhizobium erythrophlei]
MKRRFLMRFRPEPEQDILLATTFMHGAPDNGFGPTASNLYVLFKTTGTSRFPAAEIRWRGPPAYGLIYRCGPDVKCATPARPLPRRSRPKRDSSFAMIAMRSWTSRSRNLNFRLLAHERLKISAPWSKETAAAQGKLGPMTSGHSYARAARHDSPNWPAPPTIRGQSSQSVLRGGDAAFREDAGICTDLAKETTRRRTVTDTERRRGRSRIAGRLSR